MIQEEVRTNQRVYLDANTGKTIDIYGAPLYNGNLNYQGII
jgi:hypothetical protein